MAPDTQRAALTWGDSNHSSRRSPTDIVITLTKSPVPLTSSPLSFQAKRASARRSAGDFAPTAGGVTVSSGRIMAATLPREELHSGQVAASRLDDVLTS